MTTNELEPHLESLYNYVYLFVSSIFTSTLSVCVVLLVWYQWGVAASNAQADIKGYTTKGCRRKKVLDSDV